MKALCIVLLIFLTALTSCRKRPDPAGSVTANSGSLKMEFTNRMNTRPIVLNTDWYTNAHGDSLKIFTYKYYISNVSLTTTTGEVYTVPDSYFLIDQSNDASRHITMDNIPFDDYASVTFLIGVDSLHNSSGAQTGALDPVNGMIWSWNTGYIMAKMEGVSPSSTIVGNNFFFHIAGYKGSDNVLRWVTLSFPAIARVTSTKTPNIHCFNDAGQWFTDPRVIDLSVLNNVTTTGSDAVRMADNYKDMFTIDHIDP